MFDKTEGRASFGKGKDDKGASKGDGAHHHELHELPDDEGGGYHSKHTDPEGNETHEDHADYDEAKDHMDKCFGKSDGGDEEGDEAGSDDMSPEDIAGSYGRAADSD
jgi:hypothetical protein